jgi:ubiquinol-cytochrome c reductase cytochrome c subunit
MSRRSALKPVLLAVFLAAAGQALLAPDSDAARLAQTTELTEGRELYEQHCASCHGSELQGTENGPRLTSSGAASVDFMLSTGRMPLAAPGAPVGRRSPFFDDAQIRAIVAYVSSRSTGVAIPVVDAADGDLALGQQAFAANCAACHGASGTGDSIGGNQIALSLYEATPLQIAEAIRVGPGAMPRFGERTVEAEEVDAIAAYLLELRSMDNPGGLGLTRVGPVAEGFVGVVVGLGLLLLIIRLTGTTR